MNKIKFTPKRSDPVSDVIKIKHEESQRKYPELNLSEAEYVVNFVNRHPIGLFIPLLIGFSLILVTLTVILNINSILKSADYSIIMIDPYSTSVLLSLFIVFILLLTYIFCYVFVSNKFYLTNESVVQRIQLSLFSKREQSVSLSSIEDASFTKSGILQHIFDYGTVRLSTVGEEQTYQLTFVQSPDIQINILNNAVEAFKNGRPVDKN